MKKAMYLTFGAFGMTLLSCAQDGGVPSSVESKFNEKFPNAKSVKWDKENDTEWEAEFKMNGKSCSANFSLDGTWLETETTMKSKDLPNAVQESLKSNFADYKIEKAEIAETPEGKSYEVEIEKGEMTLEVVFDENGTVVKQKEVKEEDEEENDKD